MIRKLRLLFNAIEGYWIKFLIDIDFYSIPILGQRKTTDVVVSLTSYGRRVKDNVVYYTLVSLLRQTIHPSHIILWLAEDEWNINTIPKRLLKLKEKGIDIKFCKDIRSYKKLIPTKKMFPDKTIVTVDDDVLYLSDMLEEMNKWHEKYPFDIISFNAKQPLFISGIPRKYSEWKTLVENASDLLLFPVGVGGVLYPAKSLHSDVLDEELFMKLCPLADDIWFWFCGLRNGTNKRFIMRKQRNSSFDALYQYFHKGSALTYGNCLENQNNIQLRELFKYYSVDKVNFVNL